MDVSKTKRLKALEDENAKLKRLLADAMLDNTALKDLLGQMVTPAVSRDAVVHLVEACEMSERRACSAIGVDRSSVRYRSRRPSATTALSLSAALVPLIALVGPLGLAFFLFGDAAAARPNQVALLFCALVATWIAWSHGHTIDALREAAVASVTTGLPAILILAVGALSLDVATTSFVPFAFLNLLNPLISVAFAILGLRMLRSATAVPSADAIKEQPDVPGTPH